MTLVSEMMQVGFPQIAFKYDNGLPNLNMRGG